MSKPSSLFCSLTTNIIYLPETVADRPSALREQSEIDESPLAPPSQDPHGWKVLPPVQAEGTIVPDISVTAQLSIAFPVRLACSQKRGWFLFSLHLKQLSFAIGTPIPLYLELQITGDAPFGSQSIDVRLVRTLVTRSITGGSRRVDVARAVFWEAPGSSPHSMKLWGEVTAGRRLTPSFEFSRCNVGVHLVFAFLVDISS
jgi:hypothetical protein